MFTHIQMDNRNLAPVKCYLRDDTNELIVKDDGVDVNQNPFSGGSIVDDGELILQLWRDGRLAEYCHQQCTQSRHCEHEQVTRVSQTLNILAPLY